MGRYHRVVDRLCPTCKSNLGTDLEEVGVVDGSAADLNYDHDPTWERVGSVEPEAVVDPELSEGVLGTALLDDGTHLLTEVIPADLPRADPPSDAPLSEGVLGTALLDDGTHLLTEVIPEGYLPEPDPAPEFGHGVLGDALVDDGTHLLTEVDIPGVDAEPAPSDPPKVIDPTSPYEEAPEVLAEMDEPEPELIPLGGNEETNVTTELIQPGDPETAPELPELELAPETFGTEAAPAPVEENTEPQPGESILPPMDEFPLEDAPVEPAVDPNVPDGTGGEVAPATSPDDVADGTGGVVEQ